MKTLNLSALSDPALVYMYIDVLPRDASYCLKNMKRQVKSFMVVTNNGKKTRQIFSPSPELKWVQNRIRHGLLLQLPVEDCVHGFVRDRGIVSNAHGHAGRRCAWVLNMDLKDFFPSINFSRVFGLFRKCFGFNDQIAGQLARLTTYHNHLCQGFPTSPDLANFVAWKLDRRLMGLSASRGLIYTRYADDLTFSSTDAGSSMNRVMKAVKEIAREEGFTVNENKIAPMRAGRRKVVTGLVIGDDGTVNIPRKIRRLLRAAVHHWPQQTPERKASIRGWISYLNSVDPVLSARLTQDIENAESEAMDRIWSKDVGHNPFSDDITSV